MMIAYTRILEYKYHDIWQKIHERGGSSHTISLVMGKMPERETNFLPSPLANCKELMAQLIPSASRAVCTSSVGSNGLTR
jgi:hypothetical protein